MATIVRIKRSGGEIVQDCDVYIGRACNQGGWNLPESRWKNPYTISRYGSAEVCVRLYREYLVRNKELLAHLPELRGKVLGCWCKPGVCHGDVLVELVNKSE